MPDFTFDALRRWPDVEGPELFAVDATDRLVLDDAASALAAAAPGEVAVVGDRYGALTLGAVALHGALDVRSHQDLRSGERALAANAERCGLAGTFTSGPLDASTLGGARVVLLQLPRSLDALDEIAALVAEHADPDVQLFAGGRIKHMSRGMNDVLAAVVHVSSSHSSPGRSLGCCWRRDRWPSDRRRAGPPARRSRSPTAPR